jgi:hypothetical protein
MKHTVFIHGVGLLLVASTGCKARGDSRRPDANVASVPAAPRVRKVAIAEPEGHWVREGFQELVPPVRLPSNAQQTDRITVWMHLPKGEKIDWVVDGTGRGHLKYPVGTVADRVEYAVVQDGKGKEVLTVLDVRGTTLLDHGQEEFHMYRPENDTPQVKLWGLAWPRGDRIAQTDADAQLSTFLKTAKLPTSGKPLDAAGLARLHGFNQCGPCHVHNKPLAETAEAGGLPRGATDAHGFYSVLRVLNDTNAFEGHRPYDLNIDDPLVRADCPKEPARASESGPGERHYACADGAAPTGTRDIAKGLREKDPYTERVCASRRFLFDHMTSEARSAYRAAFDVCKTPSEAQVPG